MRKHILDKDFWCLQHSQKLSPPPQNRTSLCPLCATVWRTQGLMLSCYWLVLLPCIWQFPLPSDTPSACPEKENQDARRSSCFTDRTAIHSSNNSYVIISQQASWRCVPSSILLKYEELHVWMTLSTHPESLCMRNRGSFKTFVVSQLKCRCCSASSREERKTHHYKLHPTPEDGILWLPWLRRENYKKFSNCYQVALHTWLNAWCTW